MERSLRLEKKRGTDASEAVGRWIAADQTRTKKEWYGEKNEDGVREAVEYQSSNSLRLHTPGALG